MTVAANKTVERLVDSQSKHAEKYGLIGALVYYEVASTASVDHDRLENLFNHYGLSVKDLPELPSPHKVFTYCVNRGSVGISDAQVIRISKETSHDIWGIYPVEVTDDGSVMEREATLGEPLAKLGFFPDDPRNPGSPGLMASEGGQITDQPSNPVAAGIISEWRRRCNLHTNPDISHMIRCLLQKMSRIRMKNSGHLYFVPASSLDTLYRLKSVVSELGGGDTYLAVLPLADHPDNLNEVACEAKAGFEESIKFLRDKVKSFSDVTRESTKERTVEEALDLKAQLELYRDISAELVESLQSDADALVDEVRDMMGVS